jgi:hypothetical protein|tara:strand:- start:994 stop:1407 length:414 start_codon:yes stop_codon:yes gene_type:complete
MATITATLNLTSPDITGDPLNLSKTATLTKAGSNTGLDQFTGVTTVVYAAAQTAANIVPAASYVDTTVSHKVYIKNSSTGTSDFVTVELGGSNVLMGRLYPGDWCFFPYDGTLDVDIDTSAVGMKVEYAVFSQSAVS